MGINEVIGREPEWSRVMVFLDALRDGPAALVLEGEAGIGKTSLWKAALETAASRGYHVLSSRPVEAETKLSFCGLADLLGPVEEHVLRALPAPQRRALEGILLRADPEGPLPDHRALATGTLSTIVALAASSCVVVAVDDACWLDDATTRVLAFAAKRLGSSRIGFLVSVRTPEHGDSPFGLDGALAEALVHVRVGPLSPVALHEILERRLGHALAHPSLLAVHRASGGNPFFALEIAQAIFRSGKTLVPGEPLPVPERLVELAAGSLQALDLAAQDALTTAAALSRPTLPLLRAALGDEAVASVAAAEEAELVEVEHGRIRFTHPLLAAAAYSSAPPPRRRQLHQLLARVVADEEERARHLALSADGPDDALAAALDDGARRAWARGAPAAAAQLTEQALLFTPSERTQDERRRRVAAAEYHLAAADPARARVLLEEVLGAEPPGPARADALWRLGKVRENQDDCVAAADLFAQALAAASQDRWLRCAAGRDLALAVAMYGDLPAALGHARVAAELAEELGHPALRGETRAALALVEFFSGHGFRAELMADIPEGIDWSDHLPVDLQPEVLFGALLKYCDDYEGARPRFQGAYRRALERGAEAELPLVLWQMAEMECWAGDWKLAAHYAERGYEAARLSGNQLAIAWMLYPRALVDAHLGHTELARAEAQEALTLAQQAGSMCLVGLSMRVLGFLELSLGKAEAAHAQLGPLVDLATATGFDREPGLTKFLPDEIEALVAIGQLERANDLLCLFEERAQALGRRWALATAARCRAVLAAASGDPEGAIAAVERALAHHQQLPMPFELGRTLLVLGQVRRRRREKRAAKDALERAAGIFEDLGAALWAERARGELTRVGLRRAGPHELTATEERVAALAATGNTNRQTADLLFMSPKTVEANLARVYRKLGVGSRAELVMTMTRRCEREALPRR